MRYLLKFDREKLVIHRCLPILALGRKLVVLYMTEHGGYNHADWLLSNLVVELEDGIVLRYRAELLDSILGLAEVLADDLRHARFLSHVQGYYLFGSTSFLPLI